MVGGGPWFEDLEIGEQISAPAVTLTEGSAVLHQAVVGERFRLALDLELCRAVTGSERLLVSPLLVTNLAIGQSTFLSQRVRANLYYRRLLLLRPVHVGDTLSTVTEVTARRRNADRPGRPSTGLAELRIRTANQHGEPVLDFWRCPMLPLSPDAAPGDAAAQEAAPHRVVDTSAESHIDLADVAAAVPTSWRLDVWHRRTPGQHGDELAAGTSYQLETGDVVTSAPELARMTLNLAAAHYDPAASLYGRRLVYGGHTIAMAGAALTRVLPNVLTVLSWRRCDHVGPVFEGDLLTSRVTVDAVHPLRDGVALTELTVTTTARTDGPDRSERPVLDWSLVALV